MTRIASYRMIKTKLYAGIQRALSLLLGKGYLCVQKTNLTEKGKPIARWGRKVFGSFKEDGLTTESIRYRSGFVLREAKDETDSLELPQPYPSLKELDQFIWACPDKGVSDGQEKF